MVSRLQPCRRATERYPGSRQHLKEAVNDKIGTGRSIKQPDSSKKAQADWPLQG
jgi:hypothetical protein